MGEHWPLLRTALLLLASNVFMTIAWYGHLRFTRAPLFIAILGSWLIALPEYALQVPANRLGYVDGALSGYKLKIMQECITLLVFMAYAWLALSEAPRWNHAVAFALIVAAAGFAFMK